MLSRLPDPGGLYHYRAHAAFPSRSLSLHWPSNPVISKLTDVSQHLSFYAHCSFPRDPQLIPTQPFHLSLSGILPSAQKQVPTPTVYPHKALYLMAAPGQLNLLKVPLS